MEGSLCLPVSDSLFQQVGVTAGTGWFGVPECRGGGSPNSLRYSTASFPFPLRYLFASHPAIMGRVLGIVYRAIATHLIHKAGFTKNSARTGAVTLIQRFDSALNLNIHFHMLFLDGVYIDGASGATASFHKVHAPSSREMTQLAHTIAHRVGRFLER